MSAVALNISITPTGTDISAPRPAVLISHTSETFSSSEDDSEEDTRVAKSFGETSGVKSRSKSEDSLHKSQGSVSLHVCLHRSLMALQNELSKALGHQDYAKSQQLAVSIACIAEIIPQIGVEC